MSGTQEAAAVVIPPSADAIENAGSAAVEIAQVEASRDIRLAEINAESAEAVAEAIAEDASEDVEDDIKWLQDQFAGIEAYRAEHGQVHTELSDRLTAMETRLAVAEATILAQAPQLTPTPNSETSDQLETEIAAVTPVPEPEPDESAGDQSAPATRRKYRFL